LKPQNFPQLHRLNLDGIFRPYYHAHRTAQMELPAVLDLLGYSDSGNFFRRGTAAFERMPDFGHILREAGRQCHLQGVYTLKPFTDEGSDTKTPVVYVCSANDNATADKIHRLVWNQDIVPFLIVHTPAGLRLYSGFQRNDDSTANQAGLLESLVEFNHIHDQLAEFHADAIDSGELWRKRSDDVRPNARVYWKLLDNLKELAKKFRKTYEAPKSVVHNLIGKYIYLHYLRGRDFLSPRRLEKWDIDPDTVFGRTATFAGLRAVCEKLDGFLNGRVFPLKFTGKDAPTEEQIQHIAGAFAGDNFDGGWQFHLPFDAFQFDVIPIETLSMIYEQFLHLPDTADPTGDDEQTEGRKAGAYYTPIPVVNYMVAELDKRRPLKRGVRVYDPSCGSGAFLVQCYRKLIERTFPPRGKKPTPSDLATLLERHIFGSDLDPDACSVAEFSLYLTLLDYVNPADLTEHPRFKLPTLRDSNIFQTDFFKLKPFKAKFQWIAGNPPWTKPKAGQEEKGQLKKEKEEATKRVLKWMNDHSETMPVGMNAVAQAFAWRCREFMGRDAVCGLLIPAMTLFEDPSAKFRSAFFREHRLEAVANFSNLAEVLFAGRSRVPAAALFFSLRPKGATPDDLEATTIFSPLVANQESTRPPAAGSRTETWIITVNGDEVRELPYCEIAAGSGLPWKVAMWGSGLDAALLGRMRRKWPTLESLEAKWHSAKKAFIPQSNPPAQKAGFAKEVKDFRVPSLFKKSCGHGGTEVAYPSLFKVSEGLQVRGEGAKDQVQRVAAIAGKKIADIQALARSRGVFSFSKFGVTSLPPGKEFALKGRTERPLIVSEPPHIIVSAARNFAVFSDEFIVVPPRQIGIASVDNDRTLLKALALYLSSDFAFYHQFFTSTQLGIKRDVATLESLRQIPIPLLQLSPAQLNQWEALHDRLAQTQPRILKDESQPEPELDESLAADGQEGMIEELNDLVSEALELDDEERVLIHDLVHVRLALNDGKIGKSAMKDASPDELQTYAEWLQRELDNQYDGAQHHSVTVLHDARSGFIAVEPAKGCGTVKVIAADASDARTLARTREQLRVEHSQWVYFNRSLRLHRGRKTFIFKPIARMHWTRSLAMLDAADLFISTMREKMPKTNRETAPTHDE
jgi:hypothetical protein